MLLLSHLAACRCKLHCVLFAFASLSSYMGNTLACIFPRLLLINLRGITACRSAFAKARDTARYLKSATCALSIGCAYRRDTENYIVNLYVNGKLIAFPVSEENYRIITANGSRDIGKLIVENKRLKMLVQLLTIRKHYHDNFKPSIIKKVVEEIEQYGEFYAFHC